MNRLEDEERDVGRGSREGTRECDSKGRETGNRERIQLIVSISGPLVALLGVIVAAVLGYLNLSRQVSNVGNKVTEVGNRVEKVERDVLSEQLIIISPRDDESVDLTSVVKGKTPYADKNHYIIVTPLKTNEDFVQDRPIRPDSSGSWAGTAVFGTGDVGLGERFLVRVLATSHVIPPGKLLDVPSDAVPSQSITVTRRK